MAFNLFLLEAQRLSYKNERKLLLVKALINSSSVSLSYALLLR